MFQRHIVAPRLDLRVVQGFRRRVNHPVDEPLFVGGVENLPLALAGEDPVQDVAQVGGVFQPRRGVVKAGVVQLRRIQKIHQHLPVDRRAQAGVGQHIAIGHRPQPGQIAGVIGLAAAHRARVGVVVGYIPQRGGDAFLYGHINPLPPPGEPLVIQRQQGSRCQVGAGLELRLVQGVLQRFPVVGAEYVHQPAQGVLHDFRCPVVAPGPRLPEVGHGSHHQPGVVRPQRLVIQPQGRQHPGRKVLHQRIGIGQQFQQNGAPGFRFQVEGKAAFAGVEVQERQALVGMGVVVVKGRQPARRVAAGPFHLQHLGAEVGQQFGGVGAGDVVGKVDDFDAGQGCASAAQSRLRSRADGVTQWPAPARCYSSSSSKSSSSS